MPYDPERHHRRSIRLRGYDYAQAGAYFVTVCVRGRACLLGDVVDEEVLPSEVGRIVQAAWEGRPRRFPNIQMDAFVAMPNHVHGIVFLGAVSDIGGEGETPPRDEGAMNRAPTTAPRAADRDGDTPHLIPTSGREAPVVGARFIEPASPAGAVRADGPASGLGPRRPPALGEVVRTFKAVSAREIRRSAAPNFAWQRNYYEHVIRDERSLERLRAYIVDNPGRWANDALHPDVPSRW